MDRFINEYKKFLCEFGKARKMVLSTSENDRVSSRMMSVVQIDGVFYFQTDITLRKYHQIINNHNVALCIDNIQIEGLCEEVGCPLQSSPFCIVFQECFKGSYDAYSSLKNERVFAIKPRYIERWLYEDGAPYIEAFDLDKKEYKLCRYIGV